jgi:hypothetical protein
VEKIDEDAVQRMVEKRRIALLDQLVALARVTSSFHNRLEYARSLLKFLFFHSYFTMKDEIEESDESDELLKVSFFAILYFVYFFTPSFVCFLLILCLMLCVCVCVSVENEISTTVD